MILLDKGRFLVEFESEAEMVIETIRDVDGVMLTETERWYVNFIVSGLKGIGIWDKMKALYGFVGGTAASHKWNWKDMRDSDESFRLSFLGGGWIHSSTGAKPNGMSSYADTFLIPSESLVLYDTHMSFYTNYNNMTPNGADIGAVDGLGSLAISSNNSNIIVTTSYSESAPNWITPNPFPNKSIMLTESVTADNSRKLFINGSKYIEKTETILGALPERSLFLANYNYISTTRPDTYYSNHEMQFVTIGNGLTELEAIQMSHIITTAQGILGRKL